MAGLVGVPVGVRFVNLKQWYRELQWHIAPLTPANHVACSHGRSGWSQPVPSLFPAQMIELYVRGILVRGLADPRHWCAANMTKLCNSSLWT